MTAVNDDDSIQKIKCRNTLSKHLSQLVKSRFVKRTEKIKHRPKYDLAVGSHWLDSDKGLMGILNKKISTINEKSKKIKDKELLKEFVDDTQDLLIILSQLHFSRLVISDTCKKDIENNKPIPELGLNEKQMELINKLISMRINILEKRDEDLSISFVNLIMNNSQNLLSKK